MNVIAEILETANNDEEKCGDAGATNSGQSKKGSLLTDIMKANHNNDKPLARLLVVDDDPDTAHVLKLGLQKNRFLVDAFTNPEEALQHFESNSKDYYCLMLLDIRMPEISGIQLARKVKEINPSIKVVLMTAYEIKDNNEFYELFLSPHVDGFVQKPIFIRNLTNKILDIIDESKRRL
jgi:CheY-like chemotaxis protein